MDLIQPDPERQRRRLRLLAQLAETRAARSARSAGVTVDEVVRRGRPLRDLIAVRKRLAG